MKLLLLPLMLVSLAACSQDRKKAAVKTATPAEHTANASSASGLPLGKYAVYQSGSYGSFGFQFNLYLVNDHEYRDDGMTGAYTFSSATNALRFISGPLKDYTGLFTHAAYNNEKRQPMIVIDFWGKNEIPDSTKLGTKSHGYYQYAYYRPNEQ